MILDSRKFPLLFVLVPLVAGMLTAFFSDIPVTCYFGLFAVAVLYLILSRNRLVHSERYRISMIVLVSLLSGALLFALKDYRRRPGSVSLLTGRSLICEGEVLEHKSGLQGRQQMVLDVREAFVGNRLCETSGKIMVSVSDAGKIKVGDLLRVSGELEKFTNKNNPGEFDAVSFYRNRKIAGSMFVSGDDAERTGERASLNRFFTEWRNYLGGRMEKVLDGDFLGIAKALILGDKSSLDYEVMQSFSTTGSMHVLAVSGLHIGLILLMLQKILELFAGRITKRQAIVFSIVLIWLYGGLTGASPAVMRAVVMFTILSASQLGRRQHHSINNLALSAIVLLAFDPWTIFDLGFQLSYCAMAGIFLLYRPVANAWSPRTKLLQMAWEGTAVGIAATIVTTPLTLLWFYRFPNYFALANLGVMVFGFAVLLLGLVLLFVSWMPFIVKLAALVFSFSVIGLVIWVGWVDALPGAVSGGFHLEMWEVIAAFALVAAWIFHLDRKKIPRWSLLVASLLLVGLWSLRRYEVLRENQLIVFNDNRFCLAVRERDRIVAFYDKKYSGSWQVPAELDAYAAYSGAGIVKLRIEHDTTHYISEGCELHFARKKNGFAISFNDLEWFYAYGGTPARDHDRGLMTTRLQEYADPDVPTVPFVLNY
jgi:competence protein ComEC